MMRAGSQPQRAGQHDPPVHHLAQQPCLRRTTPPHRRQGKRSLMRHLAHQKDLFLFGVLIADNDSEPHTHCTPKSLQSLDVRHTSAQFNTRQGWLADSRSLRYFLLGETPASADGAKLVAEPEISSGLVIFGMFRYPTSLRKALSLESFPSAMSGHHSLLSKPGSQASTSGSRSISFITSMVYIIHGKSSRATSQDGGRYWSSAAARWRTPPRQLKFFSPNEPGCCARPGPSPSVEIENPPEEASRDRPEDADPGRAGRRADLRRLEQQRRHPAGSADHRVADGRLRICHPGLPFRRPDGRDL